MPYDINGNYAPQQNVSPLPEWFSAYKYATAEAAAQARSVGSGGTVGTGGSSNQVTPAQTSSSTKIEVSIRISGFLTPA